MRKSKRRRTARRRSFSLPRSHSEKRDLSENLHRYSASIAEQPDLFSLANPVSRGEPATEPRDDRRETRLTRFQKKEIGLRRLGHLLQFVFLLAVLVALLTLLLHSVVLYF